MMDITTLKGIGSATAKSMAEHGLYTIEDIAAGGVEKLLTIPGFSSIRAARISGEAKILLAAEMPAIQKVEKVETVAAGKKLKSGKVKKKIKKSDKKKTKKKISKNKKKEKAAKKEKSRKKKKKS